MERTKWCCNGQHAPMFTTYKPMTRNKFKYYTAVYQCKKCGQYSLRGETNQKKSWNTFVEFISEKRALEIKKEMSQRKKSTIK